jgi:type II secretory pathway component PulM
VRLSTREKILVGAGLAFFVGILFWIALWEPARKKLELLDRRVQAKQAELREIQDLAVKYQELVRTSSEIERRMARSRNVSVLSYLENVAIRQKLRERISQMRARGGETTRYYQENSVQIKMEKVTLPELVGYLHELRTPAEEESAPGFLRVRQLQIHQRFEDKSLLDVTFQVSAYEPVEKS